MDNLSLLHPRHLVLCVALSDYELKEILSGAPADLTGSINRRWPPRCWKTATWRWRNSTCAASSPSTPPPAISQYSVVNRYLSIKHEGRV